MKAIRTWQGVRMRRVMAGADPDAVPRQVTLPASWDDTAAAALAGLVPGAEPVKLAAVADAWIRPVSERALRAGMEVPLSERLHRMLLLRHGAPTASVWQAEQGGVPGFVLNLASFHDAGDGFDAASSPHAAGSTTSRGGASGSAPAITRRMRTPCQGRGIFMAAC